MLFEYTSFPGLPCGRPMVRINLFYAGIEIAIPNALNIFLELESLFDIAEMYRILGCITLDLAIDKLEGAIDPSNQICAELAAAEQYFHESETSLHKETP